MSGCGLPRTRPRRCQTIRCRSWRVARRRTSLSRPGVGCAQKSGYQPPHVSHFFALFRAVQPENSLSGQSVRHVAVDIENASGFARLSVDRLIRDAEGHDRSGIFKIPLPIQSIHLLHRRLDCVGLGRPSGLQALQQAFDRVAIGHDPLQWLGA
jgi:hypothetical protein